jgi:hypothetical protein
VKAMFWIVSFLEEQIVANVGYFTTAFISRFWGHLF